MCSLDNHPDVFVPRKVDGSLDVLYTGRIYDVCREPSLGTIPFGDETSHACTPLCPFRELGQGVIDPEICDLSVFV